MKAFSQVMLFIVTIITLYCLYQNINLLYTIIRTRKKESTLRFCVNAAGKIFYIAIAVMYIIVTIGAVYFLITGIKNGQTSTYQWALNIWAIFSIITSFQFGNIVQVGKRHMMVGRMLIDYRKMKKVDFSYHNDVSFVYGQRGYKFPTTFVDVVELRKAISRRS